MFKILKKDISEVTILIGNLLDHFDTALYSFLAPILAPIFFPHHEPVVQLILAYSILATSIITKPIGAIIFGVIAYRRGPIFGLSYSLIGVAITTVLLGCIPDYKTIGNFAPVFLIVVRALRGIFASGESTIAKLYIIENKTQNVALKSSCFYESSVIVGIILASVVSTVVYSSKYINAWRISFFVGGSVGLVGVVLRYFSWEYKKLEYKIFNKTNWIFLWQNRYNILKIVIVAGFTHITYSVAFIFLNSFVPLVSSNISLANMLYMNNYLLMLDLLLVFFIGAVVLKYKFNPNKVMLFASVVLTITIIPMFNLLENSTILTAMLVRCWVVFWGVVFACPLNLWYEKVVIDLPEKYLLVGVGSSIGGAGIGKTLTAVCLWLWHKTNMALAPAIYIASFMLLTVAVIFVTFADKSIFCFRKTANQRSS
ncbi:MAG: MFS transporter [Gammaproteobacteria bacterium]